jgi:alpha-aminoadipate/glutamate carrier protein LysW
LATTSNQQPATKSISNSNKSSDNVIPVVVTILKENQQMNANCPECDAQVALAADVLEGEIVICAECGAELEVVSVNPPELALAPEVEEDWGE